MPPWVPEKVRNWIVHPWLPVKEVPLLLVVRAIFVGTVLVSTAVGLLVSVTTPTLGPV